MSWLFTGGRGLSVRRAVLLAADLAADGSLIRAGGRAGAEAVPEPFPSRFVGAGSNSTACEPRSSCGTEASAILLALFVGSASFSSTGLFELFVFSAMNPTTS